MLAVSEEVFVVKVVGRLVNRNIPYFGVWKSGNSLNYYSEILRLWKIEIRKPITSRNSAEKKASFQKLRK